MKQRNGLQVMAGLIGMVAPLTPIMLVAIVMGCIGNLMATFITILGGCAIFETDDKTLLTTIAVTMLLFALLRGILRYAEQACNHYIAFKLLARIRHKVFASLRRLAPAKLDGKEKGNLISIITSDIELLEVFYAHTISPIAIAVLTSIFMVVFIGNRYAGFGVFAAVCYLVVGAAVPLINSHFGQEKGQRYRARYGELNTVVLDNLYGMEETLQYQGEAVRREKTQRDTQALETLSGALKKREAAQKITTDSVILAAGVLMCLYAGSLASAGTVTPEDAVIAAIAMMSSFGPTAALSALSNNLNQTLASGNRVLNLLEEEPVVDELTCGQDAQPGDITVDDVTFTYPGTTGKILEHFSLQIKENTIYGILGKSGCGKSTLLKLMMRFYRTDGGTIRYGGDEVGSIRTASLRSHISYVTQDTFLFKDTIENNIKVARADATREEVIEAAQKASLHDFILSLPNGYDTMVAELGESLSGGERQRIGLARAFLHDAPVILLDEPTSNIDSLNEGMILRSLLQEKSQKTIVLVSHRKSTMAIADEHSSFVYLA